MWREGMLAHEIAKVLGINRDGVQRLIGERVPRSERIARTTQRLNDGRSPEERVLHALRAGASVLGQSDEIKGYEASRAHGLIEGWLAASETPTSDRTPEMQEPPPPAGLTAEEPPPRTRSIQARAASCWIEAIHNSQLRLRRLDIPALAGG